MAAMNLLEALRYLAALEQHRHFGRAAQACGITQPALSNAIRALEAELGVSVVRRSRQYEGLTAEGEVVVAHAHRLMRETESLHQELHALAGAPRGRLLIGSVPTAMAVAVRFAARLRDRHPGLQPVLRSLSSPEIEAGLDHLSLDLGLGFTDRAGAGGLRLDLLPQYEESHYLVTRDPQRGPGLQRGEPIGWREAAAHPLALLTPEMHHRAVVDAAFRAAGVLPPRPALETNAVDALVGVLAEGKLAAVLPGAVLASAASMVGLQARPLVEPEVQTPIGFMTTRGVRASRALQAALAMAREPAWHDFLASHTGTLQGR